MKVAMLAAGSSIHTARWANGLCRRGHEVSLVTMHAPKERLDFGVEVHQLRFCNSAGYVLNAPELIWLLARIQPDIVHAHYASGYGTLARLSGFHPLVVSVWGSDVFDFPFEAKWKRRLLKKNLHAADRIASTSKVMKEQVERLISPKAAIAVTPFGVDTEMFSPRPQRKPGTITIGTVKSMAPKYGIETLIRAFHVVVSRGGDDLRLVLVGSGPQEGYLKNLTHELGIESKCHFVGPVSHAEVPGWLNTFDMYCALSTSESESFGVAVIEASACGLPVVVSDVGGLPEVVVDTVTGFVVPRESPLEAADKIEALIRDSELRARLGDAGRQHVLDSYSWEHCLDLMESLYNEVLTP